MFDRIFEDFDTRITIEYIDKLARRRIIDRLSESSFIGTDDRSATCHRLDRRHTEVFIYGYIYSSCSSLDQPYKRWIIRGFKSNDIRLSSNSSQDIFLIGIVLPIGEDEIFLWHIDKCIDDKIDSLRRREPTKWKEISWEIGFLRFFRIESN